MAEEPTHPRSVRAKDSVLCATRELLDEGGLPAASVDAISARSGVSKATIYKHWPCRAAVAAEAFGRRMADAIPLPDTGSARGDLAEQVRRVSAFYGGDSGKVFAQLLAACVTDPAGAPYFRQFFLATRWEGIAELWQRAQDRGEVDAGVGAGTAMDVLFGPLIFRLLTGHAPLTEAEADTLSSAALDGLLSSVRGESS
ncbi:MAG: TetR/AcrR family transcriptional regulator [Amycolatopsis sp.]|uniref:TetR/AcrR family transcriptional regulator n=1 Tax=Amycolatopsis sp. TaxID=37632 RepID=UPI002625F1D4|nr:TetR/AcrR family transcriptional regulator [Amycolatopsis sp.]MCU1684567.1 TetR/AcrR family transcriptional regulator [Amycolatopsis sp.]